MYVTLGADRSQGGALKIGICIAFDSRCRQCPLRFMRVSAIACYSRPVPVKPPPTVPTALGMVDLLASCRGKCTDQELHALKVTYMKLKVRGRQIESNAM